MNKKKVAVRQDGETKRLGRLARDGEECWRVELIRRDGLGVASRVVILCLGGGLV